MDDLILQYLKWHHTGRENAIPSHRLESRFRISGRKLRDHINTLRCAGHPICSDENGYYYAQDEQELMATIRQLTSRIGNIAGAKNGLVRARGLFPDDSGQTTLPI